MNQPGIHVKSEPLDNDTRAPDHLAELQKGNRLRLWEQELVFIKKEIQEMESRSIEGLLLGNCDLTFQVCFQRYRYKRHQLGRTNHAMGKEQLLSQSFAELDDMVDLESPPSRKRKNSSKRAGKGGGSSPYTTVPLPPCKVCGGVATGYHFGVITCEACKVYTMYIIYIYCRCY